jgi:hypothetical protein
VINTRLLNNTYVNNGFAVNGVNALPVHGGALFIESPLVQEGDTHMMSLVGNSCITSNAGPSVLSTDGNGRLFWYLSHTMLGDIEEVDPISWTDLRHS